MFPSCSFHVPLHPICLQNTLFSKKYFDRLPLEFDSYELLQTLKMISESVRILLQKKKTLFFKKYLIVYPRIRLVWTSPDAKNDQWIRAHLFVKIRYFRKRCSIVKLFIYYVTDYGSLASTRSLSHSGRFVVDSGRQWSSSGRLVVGSGLLVVV